MESMKFFDDDLCVIDFIWDQVKGKRGFKFYDYSKLQNEIYKFMKDGQMVNHQLDKTLSSK